MDYQKKYPITQLPGEFVLAEWNRGYKNLTLSYKDRIIGSVAGPSQVKKGFVLHDPELNTVELRFSERPMLLDLIIDGYHSPRNQSHPEKELKKLAAFFWIIAVFAVITSLLDGIRISSDLSVATLTTFFNLLITASYCIAAVFVGKGKPWAYTMGFCVFAFMYLLFVLAVGIIAGSLMTISGFFIRSSVLGLLIYNFKTAIAARKHARYATPHNEALLDTLQ